MWKACINPTLAALLAVATGCAGVPSDTARDTAEADFSQAVQALREQRPGDAVELLEPLAQRQPQRAGVWVNLALGYLALERHEQAHDALAAALAANPEHAEALNLLAIEQRRAGRFEQALASYRRLLELHPQHPNAHLNLAILCDIYLHDFDCARTHYRHFQSLSIEQDAEVVAWLADLERREAAYEQ